MWLFEEGWIEVVGVLSAQGWITAIIYSYPKEQVEQLVVLIQREEGLEDIALIEMLLSFKTQ
jgi:hypothetical protein